MRRLSTQQVHELKTTELGLDASSLDLTSTEAIAAAIRRAAGFVCPCSASSLVRAVSRPLQGLTGDLTAVGEAIELTLESMVAHGDLIEQREIEGEDSAQRRVLLYAAPPSFVLRTSGSAILLGIAPDRNSALPQELEARVEHINHTRKLTAREDEDLRSQLADFGLLQLSDQSWSKAPARESPEHHVGRLDALLDVAQPSPEIPGLQVLNSARRVGYYRGRWGDGRGLSGRYVGRRTQAYGADLWCYVELEEGRPRRFIDLPLVGDRWRGCDVAWRLQMALDAMRGAPQRFRISDASGGKRVLHLFSPVPMWARRRWDSAGEPVSATSCLFAYSFESREIPEEVGFLREMLWLDELTQDGKQG